MNAGFVYTGGNDVGGIVGHCGQNYAIAIKNCINTGVVHGSQPAGAIAGYMPYRSLLQNNFYDKQMCSKGGINGTDIANDVVGKVTMDLIGSNISWASTGV